jgi:hypothetical protein
MKNLITLIVVVVLGLVAFNYFQTGEFSILPASKSGDEMEVNRLRGEFRRVAQEFRQAGRAAGLSGMDTSAAAGAAERSLAGIERDLKKLKQSTDEAKVKDEIDELMGEIAEFKRKTF